VDQKSFRDELEKTFRSSLELLGPRMTLWAFYCITGSVWNELKDDPIQGEAWSRVCRCIATASDELENMEVLMGWGRRSDPVLLDKGGEESSVTTPEGTVTVRSGETTCCTWIKTTDKFPLSAG